MSGQQQKITQDELDLFLKYPEPIVPRNWLQIGDEKITYTGVDGTNLTGCTRGAASTSAASHSSGDTVQQI